MAKSDQSTGKTAQAVSWHLPCQKQRAGGVKEHELVGRSKNPAACVPEPRAAFFKEWEGEAERLLAPSVQVFCIPALVFTQSEAGVLGVRMKGIGGAFLAAMLRGAAECAGDNSASYLSE